MKNTVQINKSLLAAITITVLATGVGSQAFSSEAYAAPQTKTTADPGAKAKILNVNRINDSGLTKAVIKITAGKNDANDLKVTIKTDTNSQKLYINEIRAYKSNIINTIITAKDPNSVKVFVEKAFPYESKHFRALNPTKFL